MSACCSKADVPIVSSQCPLRAKSGHSDRKPLRPRFGPLLLRFCFYCCFVALTCPHANRRLILLMELFDLRAGIR
jgi:hypothetical protein